MRECSDFLLSVVIPCFNEVEVVPLTHERVTSALGGQPDFSLEIIYIDDGSSDGTGHLLCSIADQDERVTAISFTRNFGHQPAITAGLEHATGDAVAIIDADLQDPPEVILDMIAKWREGFDVVYGVRVKRKEGVLKRLAYATFYRIYRLLANIDVPLDSGDFALIDRRVVDVLNGLPEKNRFVRGLRTWTGFQQTSCKYERAARAVGETKYPLHKLIKLAFDGIFNFSTTPLSMIFVAGLCTSFAALVTALVYFTARIGGFTIFGRSPEDVPGFTTLIITLLFFSGVQLISVGILGEYLGRVYQESKNRPTYIIKEMRSKRLATSAEVPAPERPSVGRG